MEFPINTEYSEGGPCIASDESFILFHSSRPGGLGSSDIYASVKSPGDSWGDPINLGPAVNSSDSDTTPFLTFNREYLFFTSFRSFDADELKGKPYSELLTLYKSPRNGISTLYWIDGRTVLDKIGVHKP